MFATVFRLKVKPGQDEKLVGLGEAWNRERQPKVDGFIASYIVKSISKPGEYLGLTIFDTEENFRKNANDPEQHQWYLRMRETLEEDPEWNDGPVVSDTYAHNTLPV